MPKLISLNIERSKHLERNIPFFQKEQPGILCLQEAFEADLDHIGEELAMPYRIWLKDTLTDGERNGSGKEGYSGPAIFSRTPLLDSGSEYYYMPEGGISLEGNTKIVRQTNAQGLVWCVTSIAGQEYFVLNTHFVCTKNGVFNEEQKRDFQELKNILDRFGVHILTGDLNSPRGYGNWEQFVEYYGQDNIPADVVSTIDPELHRVKNLELVVDGIFAKAPYVVRDVRLVPGLSDHKAIVAQIEKGMV